MHSLERLEFGVLKIFLRLGKRKLVEIMGRVTCPLNRMFREWEGATIRLLWKIMRPWYMSYAVRPMLVSERRIVYGKRSLLDRKCNVYVEYSVDCVFLYSG